MTCDCLLYRSLRAVVGAVLVVQLMWVLALAVAPALHLRVHPSADHSEHGEGHGHEDHQCAVTLFLSGACDCTPATEFTVRDLLSDDPDLGWCELPVVVFLFRSRGIFEHAPPRCA